MKKLCVRVERRFGERLRELLAEQELLDRTFPITRENDSLLFPLIGSITRKQLTKFEQETSKLILVEKELEPVERKPADLVEALQGNIPDRYMEMLPHSFDIIGDIAIVELGDQLQPYEGKIGEAIIVVNSRVETVFAKAGEVSGACRLRPLRHIAGKESTQTIHTEHGIRLAVDVSRVYFSPRLSTEHDRVTNLVKPGEVIVDLFSGIGPFAILAAKRQPVTVYAIDINERAIRCLRRSLTLNKLRGKVLPLVGDARKLVQDQLHRKADRVIMNLPHEAIEYLDVAAAAVKGLGSLIHFYGISSEEYSEEQLILDVETRLSQAGVKVHLVNSRRVRPTAPHEYQMALDFHVVTMKAVMTT